MRVVIAGGHGKVALALERLLAGRGDQAVGLIRNPAQAADVQQAGAEAVVCDLEAASADDVAIVLSGADAVVFAAGAGPGSGIPRKDSVNRAASVLMADAAQQAGVRRFVQVSSMGAGSPPQAAATKSGLPTSRRRPPPKPTCAPGTWTGQSCAPDTSPTILRPAGSGSPPRRSQPARSPAPTSPRSSRPCSTSPVPATRHSNWWAETPPSPRPCTASPDHNPAPPAAPHQPTHQPSDPE